jgi:nucleotide-binding universal stress UspA family protein
MACQLARDYDARLVLLHVMPPSAAPLQTEPPANPMEPAESQECLKGKFVWPQPPHPTVRVDHRVAEGDPPAEVLRLARALKCDLIVMGTHGRTGLGRLLLGSVAEEALRGAPCPVLAVKAPPPEQAPPPQPEAVNPRDAGSYNSYAWLLATCPDGRVRDGKKAIEYARRACELQGWKDPNGLETLAAAYAEDGQFGEAIRWQRKALASPDYAAAQGEGARRKLELYAQGKPYRDTRFK